MEYSGGFLQKLYAFLCSQMGSLIFRLSWQIPSFASDLLQHEVHFTLVPGIGLRPATKSTASGGA